MNKNSIILTGAILLILAGIFKPDLGWIKINPVPEKTDTIIVTVEIDEPKDETLKKMAAEVGGIFRAYGKDSSQDALRLRDLYLDLATLISLDGEDRVVAGTEDIRQANKLSGSMLKLNIKNKYINLSKASNDLIVYSIGSDDIPLTPELRQKAAEAFRALAWGCNEGVK